MRAPSDPVARLAKLEAGRAALGPDEEFNLRDMARVASFSDRQFREIIAADEALPIKQRGSEGVPYIFNGVAVLDHLIARARAVQADRERRTERVTSLAGLGVSSERSPSEASRSTETGPAARDLIDDARALGALLDLQARVRAERRAQGELIERAEVERFLWGLLTALQTDVLAIESRVDKAAHLDVATRQAVKDEVASALVSMRAAAEAWIEGRDAARH